MTEEIIIAGFGGQGVLSMGKILAYSGVMGTANVTVILSENRISSPVLNEYDTAIILNQQSMDKFESMVKPGGVLIYDPNGIVHPPKRTDINIYKIEGTLIAAELGNVKTFNMVVLGAYLKAKPVVKMESVEKGLQKSLPTRHHYLIPMNLEAVQKGFESLVQIHAV